METDLSFFNMHDSSSQAGQDLFVIAMTQGKRNGTFFEIGAGHPYKISNCFALEHRFNWTGISVDIRKDYIKEWSIYRQNSKFYNLDIKDFDFTLLPNHIDYLQVDIDDALLGYDMLCKSIEASSFSVITFEHDIYRGHKNCYKAKNSAKKFLENNGYELLVNNVTLDKKTPLIQLRPKDHVFFEDWYINPNFVDRKVIESYKWVSHDYEPKYYYDILFK